MADPRSKKISVLIFLFAIFIMLVVVTAGWIYRMYTEQTAYSEERTLATFECSRYYYVIHPDTVSYVDGTLYFEIENTLGSDIPSIMVESAVETKEVSIGLTQGIAQPVSLEMVVEDWVLVYPRGCKDVNFKNLTFEPK
ncbi:hypothetical protein KY349_00075 [Candidatus Woesearchaeota archaeon]|jgi:flagellar basal body-associated protein FliL|nr:hypothetical protein [Candidatus Woesearchaeota archaeon]